MATSGIYSPFNLYTSLEKMRSRLSLASAMTGDDNSIKKELWMASRAIDRYCRRKFYPRQETQYFDLPSAETLRVRDDLLEVVGLSALNGASEIDSSKYWLKCGDEWNLTPYDRVVIDDSSGETFNYSGTPQRAVHLDAVWGYREQYNTDGWVDSGTTLQAAMASSVTLASIAGSTGQNTMGGAPRVTTEQIWKVDSEFMHVVNGENASDIRVIRGINGTTAASHASGATVYTWETEPNIQEAALQLAHAAYMQKEAPFTERVMVPGFGSFDMPATWPKSVTELLNLYKKAKIY